MTAIALDQPLHLAHAVSLSISSKISYLLYSTAAISFILPFCRYVRQDYHKFIALGPGGTPSTFVGYLRISYLRLFTLKDPLSPPVCTEQVCPIQGYLLHLPKRSHPRPSVAGIAPHRQLNQKPPRHVDQMLRNALVSLVKTHPTLLRIGKSCFEKHGLGLFLSLCPTCPDSECHKVLQHSGNTHVNQTCADTAEICHLHATVCFFFFLVSSVCLQQS